MDKLRFASLGSGSRGNATLVQSGNALLLVDCGFPARELQRRCITLGVDPADIDAILVTHEHADHVKGVGVSARRFGLPVWMTFGTRVATAGEVIEDVRLFGGHDAQFSIGDIRIQPISVPHDAREPVQFVFRAGGSRLGLMTDVGSITPHLAACLDGVDALLLECNHDPDMLANGPYPQSVKARVAGAYGHLANAQAAQLLEEIDHQRLSHLVVGHISQHNNSPGRVYETLRTVSDDVLANVTLLEQDQASSWFELGSRTRDTV